MPAARRSGRGPLARVVARVLIAALTLGLLPAPAHASLPATSRMTPARFDPTADFPLRDQTSVVAVVFASEEDAALCELLVVAADPAFPSKYHRARWLDPRVGRFASVDPFEGRIFDPPSLHRYLYAGADAVNKMDPTGEMTLGQAVTALNISLTIASIGVAVYDVYQGNYGAAALEFGLAAFWGVGGIRRAVSVGRWWHRGRQIRTLYNASVRSMEQTISAMRAAGRSSKEIAEAVVKLRNEAKIVARKLMDPDDVAKLAERNMQKYGDPIGPNLEQLLKQYGSYEHVIEASLDTSFWYNLLFVAF